MSNLFALTNNMTQADAIILALMFTIPTLWAIIDTWRTKRKKDQ